MITRFKDRREAGRYLAEELAGFSGRSDVIILALPRGGVPVAYEVCSALKVPMDIFLVRKLGVPGHEEFAMGAIASGGVTLLNEGVIRQLRISEEEIQAVIEQERRELERREWFYARRLEPANIHNHTVILVDDGLATGSSMKVAVRAVRQSDPAQIVVAVPVAPASIREEFKSIADEYVCVSSQEMFFSVGEWYENFSQTTDEEVRELLQQAGRNLRQSVPVSSLR